MSNVEGERRTLKEERKLLENTSLEDKRFIQPRAAFNRRYRHLSGMRVPEIIQRMVDTGKVLWIGKELKWVGTEEYVKDFEEEENDKKEVGKEDVEGKNESSFEDIVSEDDNDTGDAKLKEKYELDVSKKLTNKSKVKSRSKKNKICIARGFMVEPPKNAGKAITRMRRELKEEFEQDEDDMKRWEEVIGTDEKAVATRKMMHQEWFNRQLRKVPNSKPRGKQGRISSACSSSHAVGPSSIVPVSVSNSTSSSTSYESDTDTESECVATDEEDDAEMITGTIEGWIVPQFDLTSRSPSPAGIVEPEVELEEPEFILTEPTPEELSAKKRTQKHEPKPHTDGKIYPKPECSYAYLIAMALKNSKTGCLPVSEIYKFMCDHFPYFKSAPSGWKNSLRHNLSLKKCFEKIKKPGTRARKGCLWTLQPANVKVQKRHRKNPISIREAMSDPENLDLIEKGELKPDYSGHTSSDGDDEEDFLESATPLSNAQLQARFSRVSCSDSIISLAESRVSSTVPGNIS